MGAYTQSLREILQQNQTAQQSLLNPSDVYTISMNCLFDRAPVNVISQQYQEAFVTGFVHHFMNDEIGLETLPLWKIALNEKLINNADYINLIYQQIDKQVFADYRVKTTNASGTSETTKEDSLSGSKSTTDSSHTVTSDDNTHSNDDTVTKNGTVTGTGTIANAKTGTERVERDGTDALAKTGTDTVERTGTDTLAKTGTQTVDTEGTDELAHTGTTGTVGSNSQTTENTGTTTNNLNEYQVNSDTPMGSLSNLRTPGGNPSGTGANYGNTQTYNYMSSASEHGSTNVESDNTQQDVTGSDSSTTTYNNTDTSTKDLTDTTTYNTEDERTLDLSDVTRHATTDTRTIDTTDLTTHNTTDTETRNTTDTTAETVRTVGSSEDNRDIDVTTSGSGSETTSQTTSGTDSTEHSDQSTETEYTINWEMIMKSMSYTTKIWEIFDDLFMIIF